MLVMIYVRVTTCKGYMLAKVRGFIGSKRFFGLVIAMLVLSASWIALSGRFSMAYDENTHLGLIQLYADRWLPFWSETPPGSEAMGAVKRDPSYLYHFLLSFPYRVIDNFVQSATAQIIILRFINIGIFVLGLIVYRRILLNARTSPALAHAILAVFVLLPAVPFLAAQINYDNLLFLTTGLCVLLTIRFTTRLTRTGNIDIKSLGLLIACCLVGSLVKYAFLPILTGITLWLGYVLFRHVRSTGLRMSWEHVRSGWRKMHRAGSIALIALILLGSGLFLERYGVNVARYHTPTPECDQVLSVVACQAYGPWRRNYELHQQKLAGAPADTGAKDPLTYTAKHWLKSMTHQMVFALNGRTDYFKVGDPLLLPKFLVIIIGGIGVTLAVLWHRKLRQHETVDLLILITIVYVGALWLQGYMDFMHLGQAVAMQGRYLLPILPFVCVLAGLAFARLLRTHHAKLALATACIAILLFQGGGATVFILRSDERWYWENNAVIHVNKTARDILRRIVIDR